MSRITRRDGVVLGAFSALAAAAAALALAGLTDVAIAALCLLCGAGLVIGHLHFALRRSAYQRLQRDARESRDNAKQARDATSELLDRVGALRHELAAITRAHATLAADLAGVQRALSGDLSQARESLSESVFQARESLVDVIERARSLHSEEAAAATTALRDDFSSMAAEHASLQSDLRGIRVAQQLFSQTLIATKSDIRAISDRRDDGAASDGAAGVTA